MMGAVLAGTLCVSVMPADAGAYEQISAVQAQREGVPPMMTVRKMGLRGVESAVQNDNPTVRSLRKIAASVDTASSISGQLTQQGMGLEMQIAAYQKMIDDIDKAMLALAPDSDLYRTYAAQKRLLESQMAALKQSADGMTAQGQAAIMQVEDAAYMLKKQAENAANQMSKGAQTLLITIKNLQYTEQKLERQLAALDRGLKIMETQFSLGMISRYQLDTARGQKDTLTRAIATLRGQYESLANSLALMCGLGADWMVMPAELPAVYAGDLQAMSFEKDLAAALEHSFSVWQKQSELRKAQNVCDEAIASTVYAVESAKKALLAEQESVKAAFTTVFQTVADCRDSMNAAQTLAEQAQNDLAESEKKYKRGIISRNSYLQAQDACEDARLAVDMAELALLNAYYTYEWAKRGVIAPAA